MRVTRPAGRRFLFLGIKEFSYFSPTELTTGRTGLSVTLARVARPRDNGHWSGHEIRLSWSSRQRTSSDFRRAAAASQSSWIFRGFVWKKKKKNRSPRQSEPRFIHGALLAVSLRKKGALLVRYVLFRHVRHGFYDVSRVLRGDRRDERLSFDDGSESAVGEFGTAPCKNTISYGAHA